MAKKFEFSNEVKLTIEQAKQFCSEHYHSAVTTSHIFLAVIKVLNAYANRNGDPYVTYEKKFREIINGHGLNGANYKEAFFEVYPNGNAPKSDEKFEISCGVDLQHMLDSLHKLALKDQRQITIADLIRELFSDQSYDVRSTIELALGSSQETDAIAREMVEYFKAQVPQMTSIKDFENVKELTNLNKYVAENPQTYIGMERSIDQIRLALSCKNSTCAALVGKAGTGKTAAVYAFCQAINEGKCGGFNDMLVYQLDLNSTVAGSRFRGCKLPPFRVI